LTVQEATDHGEKGRLVGGLKNVKESTCRIFGSSLGITTALLMIIWFANALTYYGEVLLTTAVIPLFVHQDININMGPKSAPHLERCSSFLMIVSQALLKVQNLLTGVTC
jgi:hypothetical protein